MSISFPIKLKHEDILYGSEVVTVPGGQFVALVRDEDYTIDYVNGIVSILLTGKVSQLPMEGENIPLDITYRRNVDFQEEFLLESHIEVFNEVAQVTDVFELQVLNKPVLDVFKVLNRTTGEEYAIESFLGRTILISGTSAPRTSDLVNQTVELKERQLANGEFNITSTLVLPEELKPAKEHPLNSFGNIVTTTKFRFLVQGGVDILQSTYEIEITQDFSTIEMITGSTILRRSNRTLIEDVDYTIFVNNTSTLLTINFTEAGLAVIGSNSVFFKVFKGHRIRAHELFDGEDLLDTEHRFAFVEQAISEVASFVANDTAQLTKFVPFIEKQQEVDRLVFPSLVVTNQSETITYVEGEDYTIDTSFRRLVRISTSTNLNALSTVKVTYIDDETFVVDDVNIARDVVVVDYDYGTNSLDWSPSFIEEDFEEMRSLREGARFITLSKFPIDENVSVFRNAEIITVVSVEPELKRVVIEPAPATDVYTIQYTSREQTIDPGEDYYVSYKYGARRRALVDNFASLLSLTTGTIVRAESFDLINNQNKVVLSNAVSDFTRTTIYLTGDPDKTPVSTATAFDASTNTLHFTPIINAGNHTIDYPVSGFDREQLRTAIVALLRAFQLGPTKVSVVQLVEAMTGLEPEVIESITNGFLLTNDEESDFLKPIDPIESPALSNGERSIGFVPSRFNAGLELSAGRNAWVGYGALNNIRVEEGTFSFLLGTFWDGDDGVTHQLFDMMGTDEFTNRITLYKNKRNSLVFEVHDENSRLHRVTTDVTRVPRDEIHFLEEGQNTVQLNFAPANTIVDLNSDGQADIFGANRTEFIISPVFGGIEGLGLNITTLIRVPDDPSFLTQSIHGGIANRLRTLANIYEQHNAKLTIQTELSFIKGSIQFDNVLLELVERGHDVHLFLDIPQDVISDSERNIYILERRNALAEAGIGGDENDGVSGGFEIEDFASRFPALGFEYASGFVDPITGEALLDGRTDVFRTSTGPDFTVPDPEGPLVYLPGDMDIEVQIHPLIVQSFIPITNSLLTAVTKARPDVINTWYFTLNITDFTTAEIVLFEQWLANTVDPLVATGQVFWRTLSGTFQVFREFEEFLEVNQNRVRFVTAPYGGYGYGGTQVIRALTYDSVTGTLTFDAVEKSGFYLFSYISGFTKYEEAEHLITATWKLHTKDAQPPMIKLFLDGELVNHKVFGDL